MNNQFKIFAENFSIQAGDIMKEYFQLGMAKTWKSDNTPVTEADLKINSLLIKAVRKNFPSHSVKGEEESAINAGSEYTWVCDPVDGTIPFSHGIPTSTFSLALVKNGKPILGVVNDPFLNRRFSAAKGSGAFLNNSRIKVSKARIFKGNLAAYEMFAEARYDLSKFVAHMRMVEKIKLMSLASIIYPSVLVAAGEIAFTIFPGTGAHDAAAVKIIVEEAGGRVTNLFGQEQSYNAPIKGFIASNGFLHNKLVTLAKKFIRE